LSKSLRHLEYWLHQGWWNASFYFLLPSNSHMMLHLRTLLVKPMFKINKPLLILKNHAHDVAKYLVMEYFATSHKIYQMENKYTRNILWHGMEYFQKFLLAQVRRSTCSHIIVVGYTSFFFFFFNFLLELKSLPPIKTLARFGYRHKIKVEKFKHPFIFFATHYNFL